jgi:hypothetical protein
MSKINVTVKPFNVGSANVYHMVKDGTNYDLVTIQINGGLTFGNNALSDGILVINGIGNRAQLFNPETAAVFDPLYVGEKLQDSRTPTNTDMKNFSELLQAVVSPKHAESKLEFQGEASKLVAEVSEFDIGYKPKLVKLLEQLHAKNLQVFEDGTGITLKIRIPFSDKSSKEYALDRLGGALE